jgi:phospholipase C
MGETGPMKDLFLRLLPLISKPSLVHDVSSPSELFAQGGRRVGHQTIAPERVTPSRPTTSPLSRRAIVVLVVVLSILAVAVPYVILREQARGSGISPGSVPIQHIVVLMMENRAYDNLFGTYCQQVGPVCPMTADGIPAGTCVPYYPSNPARGCVRPYPFTAANYSTPNLPHVYSSSILAIDNGSMDGFYQAEGRTTGPFGYYNGSVLPTYWDVAEHFALGDRFLSSALSYSLPNHWYLLAGQAPQNGFNGSSLMTFQKRHDYLNSSNATPTVVDLLNRTPSVTWKYYDWSLLSYQAAISTLAMTGGYPEGAAYNFWSPLAAKYESYTSWYVSHFVPRSTFFTDAAAGTLPNVAWMMPNPRFSDHAPANLTQGEAYVASVVNAVETSPQWASTALFITWDDYGGFYDHVAPPQLDPLGLSFRVPMIVVSPYTPQGLVVHSLGYFESLTRFVEWRFGLGCLTPRDCTAPLPLDYFDFHMAPRSGILFPTNPSNATYPLASITPATPGEPPTCGGSTVSSPYCVDVGAWDSGPPPDNASVTALD